MNLYSATILIGIFFLFHFLIFKSRSGANFNLFSEANLTCIYHYTLSAIVNESLVLYFMAHYGVKESLQNISLVKKSLLILWIYLAICSNVLQNEILAAYVGMVLTCELLESRHTITFKNYVVQNKIELTIISFWLIALFFEAHGGRANHIGVSLFSMPLSQAAHVWLNTWRGMSKEFVLIVGVIILYAVIAYGWKCGFRKIRNNNFQVTKEEVQRFLELCMSALILVVVYLILFGAKAGVGYLTRPGVLFPVAFYIFLCIVGFAAFSMTLMPKAVLFAPIFLLIGLAMVMRPGKYFRENTIGYVSGGQAMAVSRDLISQIQKTDSEGQGSMVLMVPKGDNRDNWPHPFYMGPNISRTLFYHGLITKELKVKIQPDTQMNKKYGIPIPKQ